MTDLGSQLRRYFEGTTEPVTLEEVMARRTVVVGEPSDRHGASQSSPDPTTWWSGARRAVAVAMIAVLAFVGLPSLLTGPQLEVAGVDSAEAAVQAIEELHRALAERDVTVVEDFFGEDVVLNSYLGLEFVGSQAAEYLMRISVAMTISDVSEPIENADGSFTIVVLARAESHRYPEAWTYRVVMDAAEVVAIDLVSIDPEA